MSDTPPLPQLTEFEARLVRSIAIHYRPNGRPAQVAIRLMGNKQVARTAAAQRLEKKGLLCKTETSRWYLTERGKELALSTR